MSRRIPGRLGPWWYHAARPLFWWCRPLRRWWFRFGHRHFSPEHRAELLRRAVDFASSEEP